MARANHRRSERLARRRVINRIIIISLILLSIGLIFISRTSDQRFAPLRNSIEGTAGRLISVVSFPFRVVKTTANDLKNLRDAKQDNDRLREENIELKQYKFRFRAMEAKLKRLENILNVEDGLDVPDNRIAVRVISETRGPFVYSVLINAGRKAGIKVGYPVVTDNHMIGHVIRIGERSSRVLLLQDLNSRVSVVSQETDARAILIGKNDELPELAFYDNIEDWAEGDTIVTSGDDGVLPQGLPIGHVSLRGNSLRVILESGGAHDWAWVYPFDAVQTPEEAPANIDALQNGSGAELSESIVAGQE